MPPLAAAILDSGTHFTWAKTGDPRKAARMRMAIEKDREYDCI
jgi:hypothetical protein